MLALILSSWAYFGDPLPNTFYVKSASSGFDLYLFAKALLPAAGLALLPPLASKKYWVASTTFIVFSVLVAVQYSTSQLAMNYADRFFFHLAGPAFLYSAFLLFERRVQTEQGSLSPGGFLGLRALIAGISLLGLVMTTTPSEHSVASGSTLIGLANIYPRQVVSHGALGQEISRLHERGQVDSIVIADAGIVPFVSGVVSLDNIGLASRKWARLPLARQDLIDEYSPEVVVLQGFVSEDGTSGVVRQLPERHEALEAYMHEHEMVHECSILSKPATTTTWDSYTLEVFTKATLHGAFDEICEESFQSLNRLQQWEFLRADLENPPWQYWSATAPTG